MKNAFILIRASLLMIITYSCVETIDFDNDASTSELVVIGIINPDSLIKVHLSQSVSVLDYDSYVVVQDKEIEIFENESYTETITHKKGGYYISESITPYSSATYNLKTTNDKNEIVTSSVTLPFLAEILNVEANIIDNNWVELQITFSDPVHIKNYYRISLEEITGPDDSGDNSAATRKVVFKEIKLENNTFLNSMGSLPGNEINQDYSAPNKYCIFSDQIINGSVYTLKIQTQYRFAPGKPDYSFVVNLQALSEGYYNYLKTISAQNAFAKNNFMEPVSIYTNIRNGVGIWGAVVPSKKVITLIKQ